MNKQTLHWIIVAALLNLSACGGGGGGDDRGGSEGRVTISATVGLSYNIASTPSLLDRMLAVLLGKNAMAISSTANVDKVVAIPSFSGTLSPADLQAMKTADIAADGSFSLSLDKSYNWVLLLVDSETNNWADRVAGYVAVTIDDTDTMVALSGSKFSKSLNLGTLSRDGDEARSSSSDDELVASFDFTLAELKAIARADDAYKHLINLYLNYDPTTGKAYQAQLGYSWSAGLITDTSDIPLGSDINDYQLESFGIGIETANIDAALRTAICQGSTVVKMLPPANISNAEGYIWGPSSGDTGFENDGEYATGCSDSGCMNIGEDPSTWLKNGNDETDGYYCYDDDFSIQVPQSENNSLIGFGGGTLAVPVGGMPDGLWSYQVGSEEVARFDLAVASPENNGVFDSTPIPGIQMVHGDDGELTGMVVNWFQYDGSSYVELNSAEMAAFDDLVADSSITIIDNQSGGINRYDFEVDTEQVSSGLHNGAAITFPAATWYMPGFGATRGAGDYIPDQITIGLNMSGVSYNFSWNE